MIEFTFTTREEYLSYKKNWKLKYDETSKNIRKTSINLREACRAFSKVQSCSTPEYKALEKARYDKRLCKAQATELIFERHASKIEAANQRACRLNKINS